MRILFSTIVLCLLIYTVSAQSCYDRELYSSHRQFLSTIAFHNDNVNNSTQTIVVVPASSVQQVVIIVVTHPLQVTENTNDSNNETDRGNGIIKVRRRRDE
jgi:hypothetical protein